MQTSTLRPGLLVSLKTSVHGNVSYRAETVEPEHITEEGVSRAVWETIKTIDDPDEFKAATVARSKCRSLIKSACSDSAFGLLCPEAEAAKLEQAINEAQAVARAFNDGSALTKVSVYVVCGRIAQDDVQAVRAINSEVRELLETVGQGLERLDVKVIRDACNKAREIGGMLQPEAQARIQSAIDAARSAARRIVKAGEAGAVEIDAVAIRACTTARTAFLDLDEAAPVSAPATVQRTIDLEPETMPADLNRMAQEMEAEGLGDQPPQMILPELDL